MLRSGWLRRVPWAAGLPWAGWLAAILLARAGTGPSADSPSRPRRPEERSPPRR